ncbi:PREDICTED: leucine-rich repeat-containing protein C10orf11-like [Amphimedon queenslandica]|uniref:U2A'/phosphoprotein 32 family A C-terminal domain-containing protein n=1 Tax=Amphimedon queenslandica TaxID=400682 RepID=A0A1X7VLD0_AMPQE|nr:PREDICTED: leucine-rich repeat-containing protein C10orf11-like [Amphimedon queenslandica]|eukprot:XP_011410047.2 PREDICTED: leucine-rich repeat-containing protein C10orf11-like [Amphimedon queenslandica]
MVTCMVKLGQVSLSMSRGRPKKDGNRPSEPSGRVTLAHRELNEVPRDVFLRPSDVRILDIGYNNVTDFCFLQILTSLTSLVLDNNSVTSHTSFPYLPSLELLWVNGNKITNLALFIDKISTQFPNLRYLSMMKNDAAPSYFNGGTRQQYLDYRYYTISQIPRLCVLDDTPVTEEERKASGKIFGPQRKKTRKHQVRRRTETTPLLEDTL